MQTTTAERPQTAGRPQAAGEDEGRAGTDRDRQGQPAVDGVDEVDGWVEIRSGRGRLLCRIDVERLLLEVKPKGGAVELVDLRPLLEGRKEGKSTPEAKQAF